MLVSPPPICNRPHLHVSGGWLNHEISIPTKNHVSAQIRIHSIPKIQPAKFSHKVKDVILTRGLEIRLYFPQLLSLDPDGLCVHAVWSCGGRKPSSASTLITHGNETACARMTLTCNKISECWHRFSSARNWVWGLEAHALPLNYIHDIKRIL